MRSLRSLLISLALTITVATVLGLTTYRGQISQAVSALWTSLTEPSAPADEAPEFETSGAISEEGKADDELEEAVDPALLQAKVEPLIRLTEQYNQRRFDTAVPLNFLTRAELRDKYVALAEAEDSAAELEIAAKELEMLGLIPSGLDLHALLIDLMTEQIAGFYEFDTKAMYLIGDDKLSAMDKAIIVHELTHALQDQVRDLAGYEDSLADNDDAALAFSAALEGQATQVMQQYLRENVSGLGLYGLLLEAMGSSDSELLEQAPRVIQRSLTFPYLEGLTFYTAAGEQGLALLERLPISTEQILHPDKYLAGESPLPVDMDQAARAVDTASWTLLNENSMGEASWLITFEQYGSAETAKVAAAGWGGDRYRTYENQATGTPQMVVASRFDTTQDAEEFAYALINHFERVEGYQVDIFLEGDRVNFTITPGNSNTLNINNTSTTTVVYNNTISL